MWASIYYLWSPSPLVGGPSVSRPLVTGQGQLRPPLHLLRRGGQRRRGGQLRRTAELRGRTGVLQIPLVQTELTQKTGDSTLTG